MNIQGNTVAPGMVGINFSKPFLPSKQAYQYISKGIPAKRIVEPIDVANPTLFLASEAAGLITGQILLVDGDNQ